MNTLQTRITRIAAAIAALNAIDFGFTTGTDAATNLAGAVAHVRSLLIAQLNELTRPAAETLLRSGAVIAGVMRAGSVIGEPTPEEVTDAADLILRGLVAVEGA